MTTLIYIGLNHGNGFQKLLESTSYDKYIGFEPIPFLANMLKNKYSKNDKVEIIESAITDMDGEFDFYITDVNGSSSLFEVTSEWRKNTGNNISTQNKIKVKGINLLNFLNTRNIEFIDHYVSDAEGNDFTILSYLKSYIDQKKIKLIQVESEVDYIDYEQRKDQPKNKESDFMYLLGDNYEIYHKQEGNYNRDSTVRWANRDLFFKLK